MRTVSSAGAVSSVPTTPMTRTIGKLSSGISNCGVCLEAAMLRTFWTTNASSSLAVTVVSPSRSASAFERAGDGERQSAARRVLDQDFRHRMAVERRADGKDVVVGRRGVGGRLGERARPLRLGARDDKSASAATRRRSSASASPSGRRPRSEGLSGRRRRPATATLPARRRPRGRRDSRRRHSRRKGRTRPGRPSRRHCHPAR